MPTRPDTTDYPEPRTAREVADALAVRWPDTEHLHIAEAPQNADRSTGRKLDVLVLNLWASRGFEREGVEIKISVADWRRELKNAEKSDWWWRRVHRFWVAAPATVAEKIKSEIPAAWGLLALGAGKGRERVRVLVDAPKKHDPEPLTLTTHIGLLRAGSDSGFGALSRAEGVGYNRGYAQGKKDGSANATGSKAAEQLATLTDLLDAFTAASGVDPREAYSGEHIGTAFKIATNWQDDPTEALNRLRRLGAQLDGEARRFERLAASVKADLTVTHAGQSTEGAEAVTEEMSGQHDPQASAEAAVG
jgi:hypothetical protein